MRLLERSILCELLRVFGAALSSITVLLMFAGVMQEATRNNLGAAQVLEILPYVVPSLMPFTIPATLLLTVCIVYGRMAGDLEVVAVKSAGLSVLTILWPSFLLASVLSLVTFLLTDQFIPWARGHIQRTIVQAMEEIFLNELRTQYQVLDPRNGISISVTGVQGRTLIQPTIRYLLPGGRPVTIQAERALVEFNTEDREVVLHYVRAHVFYPPDKWLWLEEGAEPVRLPAERNKLIPRELTIETLQRERARSERERAEAERRRNVETVFALSQGDFDRFCSPDFNHYLVELKKERERFNKLHTEIHNRIALSCSSFFFVLLGSPAAILLARKQFLMVFGLCFLPIVAVYYPIVLASITISRTFDWAHPALTMWSGNLLLGACGGYVLRRVMRH